MLYLPEDFRELNIDGLRDTVALSSAIPEADLRKIRLPVPHTILNEGPLPEFQIMAANGQLKAPIATVELRSGEYGKRWHKNSPMAILKHNTVHHSSIDCAPNRVFHGRVARKILDHKQ